MEVRTFVDILGADFFTGVPDSQLKALANYVLDTYGLDARHHVIAANEGNCAGIAAGYHLATGRVPVIYLQNSGEGNLVNPITSLLNDKVYAIPAIFVIGWRGEPGVHDEPQHIFQGEITLKLLDVLGIDYFVIGRETSDEELRTAMRKFRASLEKGGDCAFVVKKGALTYEGSRKYTNSHSLRREEILSHIVRFTGEDPIVSTTGKASRELFEIREAGREGHGRDFLTVGSMGHASSIALGIASQKPGTKVWCVDGDGALIMHMGAMAVLGKIKPKNFVHIVINNEAHESVGGMPTAGSTCDFAAVARACGYPAAVSVSDALGLDEALKKAKEGSELSFIEIKSAIGARADLGRPTTTPQQNKEAFMAHLAGLKD